MNTTYSVDLVPNVTRVSHRAYSHAIIGRLDGHLEATYMRNHRVSNKTRVDGWDRKLWEASKREADAEIGTPYRSLNGHDVQPNQTGIDAAIAFITRFPSSDDYLADQEKRHQEDLAAAIAQGVSPDLQVLQWNQSLGNAEKTIKSFQSLYSDVQIVEINKN